MTKQEFLERLRLALSGRVSAAVVTENINFYEDYISTEVRKGKTEEEVLEMLGDPRLIARTIAETNVQAAGTAGGRGNTFAEETDADGYPEYRRREAVRRKSNLQIPVWAWLILAVIVVVLVLGAVFSILSAVLPFLLPILIVVFLVKLFRDWLN